MTDPTTQRIIPVRCFQCGMLLNDKEENFWEMCLRGQEVKATLDAAGVTRLCCRANLVSPGADPRLRRVLPETPGIAEIVREPRSTRPFTLRADGTTEPVEDHEL